MYTIDFTLTWSYMEIVRNASFSNNDSRPTIAFSYPANGAQRDWLRLPLADLSLDLSIHLWRIPG